MPPWTDADRATIRHALSSRQESSLQVLPQLAVCRMIRSTASCLFLALVPFSASAEEIAQELAQEFAKELGPEIEAAGISFSQTGDLDMGAGRGELDITRVELNSILSPPITLVEGLTILPWANYRFTGLNTSGVPVTDPIRDEGLHSLSVSSLLLHMRNDSPWMYGGWARAELASDFQHIDGDDFTFDLAAGVGYRFNPAFTLAAGVAVINLNGDETFYPGINFDWIINPKLRASLYGPVAALSYTPTDEWILTLRGDPTGGVWNVTDDTGQSRSIDLSSYRVGFYASRRLYQHLWVTAGAGVAFANDLDYTTPSGRTLVSRDPDAGAFGSIGLRLLAW